MGELDELVREHREEILKLAEKHGASNVRVFGSVARGEATETSDVDFLVDFPPDYRLWDRIGLPQDLEDLLGRKVDVVLAKRLREMIRDDILRDAVRI
jgi:predicted nucleotidyltransferase